MKKNNWLFIISSVLLISLYACSNKHKQTSTTLKKQTTTTENKKNKGIQAPFFALKNKNGETITPKELSKSKEKLFVFTDSECQHCIDFMPELDKFAKAHKSFEIIVFETYSSIERLQKLYKEKNYHFTMLICDEETSDNYEIAQTPTIYLVNEHNYILNFVNANTKEELENALFRF